MCVYIYTCFLYVYVENMHMYRVYVHTISYPSDSIGFDPRYTCSCSNHLGCFDSGTSAEWLKLIAAKLGPISVPSHELLEDGDFKVDQFQVKHVESLCETTLWHMVDIWLIIYGWYMVSIWLIYDWLVVTGTWLGYSSHSVGNFVVPIEISYFSQG